MYAIRSYYASTDESLKIYSEDNIYLPYWIENTSKVWTKMSFNETGIYEVILNVGGEIV